MATFDIFRPTRPASSGSFFSNLFGSVVSWNDRRVTIKMLSTLTARELDDIGLTRSDISNFEFARR